MIQNMLNAPLPQATATTPPTTPPAKSEPKSPEAPLPQKTTDKKLDRPRRITHMPSTPVLRFSPVAWAKLLYFRDRQETEVGGFAVTSARDLLKVEDFITVKQDVSVASVSFDDQAVADFFEAQVDAGRKPEQFGRVWLHTHPGDSPHPSGTDEETFARVFGACQWALMFILARGGKSYARLRFNVGPGGSVVIPVDVDFGAPFGPSQEAAWEAEYKANIGFVPWSWGLDAHEGRDHEFGRDIGRTSTAASVLDRISAPDDWMEKLEGMEPAERLLILDELSARPDLWEDDIGGFYGG